MAYPRLIRAEEIVAERKKALLQGLFHTTNRDELIANLHSRTPNCSCLICTANVDPSGNETAAYMNCAPSSFDKTVYLPTFLGSQLFDYSFYKNRTTGLYLSNETSPIMIFCSTVASLKYSLTQNPPPSHILRLYDKSIEDHYYLNKEANLYSRYTYMNGVRTIPKQMATLHYTPEEVIAKVSVMIFSDETVDLLTIIKDTCEGCIEGDLNQINHMKDGGCLEHMYEYYCEYCRTVVKKTSTSHLCNNCKNFQA